MMSIDLSVPDRLQATLTVAQGEFVGLVGPNGAGKTTLLRASLGLLPATGPRDLAKAAFLPQMREIAWPMPVERIVGLGGAGPAAVDRAIARMELQPLRHRRADALSGGEQARVLIARALAQEVPLLLADEPIAGLDPAAQIAAMEVFTAKAQAGAVVASIHDLGLAARFCTRLVVLCGGRIVADGPPSVLTPDLLAGVFGIRAWFRDTEEGPVFQPLSRVATLP